MQTNFDIHVTGNQPPASNGCCTVSSDYDTVQRDYSTASIYLIINCAAGHCLHRLEAIAAAQGGFRLYPNPTNGMVTPEAVELPAGSGLQLYDAFFY